MNKLGRLMKDDLTTVSCVSESSEHTFYVQCVVYVSIVYKVDQYVHHIHVCAHV